MKILALFVAISKCQKVEKSEKESNLTPTFESLIGLMSLQFLVAYSRKSDSKYCCRCFIC